MPNVRPPPPAPTSSPEGQGGIKDGPATLPTPLSAGVCAVADFDRGGMAYGSAGTLIGLPGASCEADSTGWPVRLACRLPPYPVCCSR